MAVWRAADNRVALSIPLGESERFTTDRTGCEKGREERHNSAHCDTCASSCGREESEVFCSQQVTLSVKPLCPTRESKCHQRVTAKPSDVTNRNRNMHIGHSRARESVHTTAEMPRQGDVQTSEWENVVVVIQLAVLTVDISVRVFASTRSTAHDTAASISVSRGREPDISEGKQK